MPESRHSLGWREPSDMAAPHGSGGDGGSKEVAVFPEVAMFGGNVQELDRLAQELVHLANHAALFKNFATECFLRGFSCFAAAARQVQSAADGNKRYPISLVADQGVCTGSVAVSDTGNGGAEYRRIRPKPFTRHESGPARTG